MEPPSAPPPATLSLGMCPRGAVQQLRAAGRAVRASLHPLAPQLLAFAAPAPGAEATTNGKSRRFPQDQRVLGVSWLSLPASRAPFVSGALDVFVHAHAAVDAAQADRPARIAALASASCGYQAAIHTHLKTLESRIAHADELGFCRSAADGAANYDSDELRREAALFSGMHSIWHLAHILFFDNSNASPQPTTLPGPTSILGKGASAASTTRSSSSVLHELLEWNSSNYRSEIVLQFQALSQMLKPEEHPDFWPYIQRCLLHGYFNAAITILRSLDEYRSSAQNGSMGANGPAGDFDLGFGLGPGLGSLAASGDASAEITSNPLDALKHLLTTMPTPENSGNVSAFTRQWLIWRDQAAGFYADGKLNPLIICEKHKSHFVVIFGILAGIESVILDASTSWREALVGLAKFMYPQLQAHNFKSLLAIATGRFQPTTLVDLVQTALLEFDIPRVLRHVADLDWWLATHLVDMFDKSGDLKNLTDLDSVDEEFAAPMAGKAGAAFRPSASVSGMKSTRATFAEWYCLSYAEYLLSNPLLWNVAIEYLVRCPKMGREALSIIIPRLPLTSDLKVRKLLAFCRRHRLRDAERELQRVLAQQARTDQRCTAAIVHSIDAGDERAVSRVCDDLLQAHFDATDAVTIAAAAAGTNRTTNDGVWTISDSAPIHSIAKSLHPGLAFRHSRVALLTKYHNAISLIASGKHVMAGTLFLELLTSSAAPRFLWRRLLLDLVPLLECESIVFSVQDTYELMRCLEDVVSRDRLSRWHAVQHFAGRQSLSQQGNSSCFVGIAGASGVSCGGMGANSLDSGGMPDADGDENAKLFNIVRLALSRNLARVMLAPDHASVNNSSVAWM